MTVPGILSVHPTNARYLRAGSSTKPLWLAGFHTWYDVQDGGGSDPPDPLDWDEYITRLRDKGCNFTKLWAMETGRGWSDATNQWFIPTRYTRTGPGNDNDGKLKFDLTSVNSDYLDRLEDRVSSCNDYGIYVVVQFFQGWQIEVNKGGTGDPCSYHPYLLANNINSVDGDDNSDGDLDETHWPTAQGNNTLAYQEDLVEAIIDRLNSYDNIIWEVSNEDTNDVNGYNTAWQEYMISHIATYESGKAKQHLIGFTKQWPNSDNTNLDDSDADWVSYDTNKADAEHSSSDPVSFYDTDHTVGLTSDYVWIWECLCRGHGGAWYMDEWDGALYGSDRRENATYELIRANLGYALQMSRDFMNMPLMTPQGALSSSGFCLANTARSGSELLIFDENGGSVTVDLSHTEAIFQVEWLRCSDGTRQAGSDQKGGSGSQGFTSPFGAVASVLYLRGDFVDDNPSTVSGVTTTTTTYIEVVS